MIRKASIRERGEMFGPIGALLVLVLLIGPATAQEPKLVDTNTDWTVYVHESDGERICFTVSEPRSQKPEGVRRGPAYFYVSTWPGDDVRHEISVKMGYPLREGVDVDVSVGDRKFALFPKEEGAYVDGQETEQGLVEAMRRGATMVVQGRSERGTLTTDEYSLMGITASLDRVAEECS